MPDTGSPLAGVTARFPARPEGLNDLHAAFDRFFAAAERAGASILGPDRVAFVTAAGEIAANIVDHGCHHLPDSEVIVELSRRAGRIEAHFEDRGMPVGDPEPERADPVPHLGIGLTIARECLDELAYERDDGTNHWRLMRLTEKP